MIITVESQKWSLSRIKLQLHDAIYRLQFYSNSLTHILLLSSSHNNVASIQKNRSDISHRVIVALRMWNSKSDPGMSKTRNYLDRAGM